ncbi:hypothetical protein MHB48_10825 [Psychrobacillus sp. FSL H8-0483]|uniref:hypothetical protein n=1 Tax=Psychrobacillus sp. FSL H8-0483 TaxID=2921389 RepID=UPI00315A90F4
MPDNSANVIHVNETNPIADTTVNPCNGEVINFTGSVHVQGTGVFAPSGRFNGNIHNNISITGKGDMGNIYRGSETYNNFLNLVPGAITNETHTVRMISKGSAPNFTMTQIFHITINPDGTVTVVVQQGQSKCVG